MYTPKQFCLNKGCEFINSCIKKNYADEGGPDYLENVAECIHDYYTDLVSVEGYEPEEAQKIVSSMQKLSTY